jgi:hypothetical protein
MVAALRTATDREPEVAGKPAPALMADALSRGDFHTPLVIGDRLDTDIAGANAAEMPSLLVLCGVNNADDAIWAVPEQRPDFIAADLRALAEDVDGLRVAPQAGWHVDVDAGAVTVRSTGSDPGDALSVVRAIAAAVWDYDGDPRPTTITAVDDAARQAVERCALTSATID